MAVADGAPGYVRIAGALIAATFGGEASAAKPSAAAGDVRPAAVRLGRGDRLRPRRAAAFARCILAHDAARTRARDRGGDGAHVRAARARHADRTDDEVSRWPTRSTGRQQRRRCRRSAPPSCRTASTTCRSAPISLTISANGFARAMTQAFTQSVVGGKQFDDVLKSLALRISSMAVTAAFKPLASGLASGLGQLFSGLFGGPGGGGKSRSRHGRDQAVRGRRRHRHADLFSAVRRRPRAGRRGRPGGDRAAGARPRRPARRRGERQRGRATSPSRSRRPTSTASAAPRPTSPARSPARWRAASAACERRDRSA